PNGGHPLIESKRGVLKDAADFDGELLLAGFAEPQTARLDERVFVAAAARTFNVAIRPAQIHGIDKGAFWVREVNDRFLQCFRGVHGIAFHTRQMYAFCSCVSSIFVPW